MNCVGDLTRHELSWLGCVILLLPGRLIASAPGLTSGNALNDAPPVAAYHDHYIADGTLRPDISRDDGDAADSTGLARSVRIEGVTSLLTESSGGIRHSASEEGVILNSQWDTEAYGAWSADFAQRLGGTTDGYSGRGHGLVALSERSMPFDGGWAADAGVGDVNNTNIGLARFQTRFILPTAPLQGIANEWRGPSGLQIVAAGGEPGILEGIKVPTFDTLGGSLATVGAQWSPSSQWSLGGQILQAHDINFFATYPGASDVRTSATTSLLSAAWQGANTRAQLTMIDGSLGDNGNSIGAWLDAIATRGADTQNFGIFRIDPDLSWGNQLITDDLQGAYYQFSHQSRRWFADLGIDQAWSVSGRGTDSTFLASDGRYQMTRDVGAGGIANARVADGLTAWSVGAYVDSRNAWGVFRGQADFARSDEREEVSLSLSQGWNPTTGARISTSIGIEQLQSPAGAAAPERTSRAASLSVNGGGDINASLTFDANVRWGVSLAGPVAPSISANATLVWQFASRWTLLADYYESRTGAWSDVIVESPLTAPVVTPIPSIDQRGVFLTLRYQNAAGAHFAPLGGAPGAGSGRLTGTIYLDANDNNLFDAGEAIAANITVILDGRYSVLTDRAGHFDFTAVVAGTHELTVLPDNLPLPWGVIENGIVKVTVKTRDRTDVSVPVTRHLAMTRQ